LQPVKEAPGFAAIDGGGGGGDDEAFWLSRRRKRPRAASGVPVASRLRLWFDWCAARSDAAGELGAKAAILLVLATAAYGFTLNGDAGRAGSALFRRFDRQALRWGFGIERVVVEGHRYLSAAEIGAALGDRSNVSILSYDTEAARERLEKVGWIKSAKVTRLWPSTLAVELEERKPFALWRPNGVVDVGSGAPGRVFVVDAEGTVLGPAEPGAFPAFLLVEGAGAPKAARRLMTALWAVPQLKARLEFAERISDRRWDLVLTDGVRIKLAEGGLQPAAFNRVLDAISDPRLPIADVAALDFRVPDQIGLELKDQSEENRRRILMLLARSARPKGKEQL
jgi:cell division protein FtsQ